MFARVGMDAHSVIAPNELDDATRIVLPGVGNFENGVKELRARGLWEALDGAARIRKVPVLGICLGMQLMFEESEESRAAGFGWIRGSVRRFSPEFNGAAIRVPHMGWNSVVLKQNNPLWRGLPANPRFYFVHSYVCEPADAAVIIGETDHGGHFCAAFQWENFVGVQFHPEKSHEFGMQVLRNFGTT
jgi:glutamine amidotransferase